MSSEFLQSLFVEKLWKKWPSLFALVGIILFTLAKSYPDEWNITNSKAFQFYCTAFVSAVSFVWYTVLCVKEHSIPRAKGLAVLFVIDTESDALFQEVKHKLVTNFSDYFTGDEACAFTTVCLSIEQVSKYDLHKKKDTIALLKKTNCMLIVRVRYHVDSVSNAENFEMAINYSIIHPDFQENSAKLLQTEMNLLAIPIRKRRFKKENNIDNLDFTAQALSIISQYLFSIVCLLSGKIDKAYTILTSLHHKVENGDEAANHFNIDSLVKVRLFEVCMSTTRKYYDLFYHEKSTDALIQLNEKLEEANKLFPNTYDYFLGKAYYLVAFALDGNGARKYINECKQFHSIQTWKYSEAFLSAFHHNSPKSIIRKYDDAFKVQEDLLRIADYIEYIIEKAPNHTDLHLAAALVYDHFGETILASEHFKLYLETDAGKKVAEFIHNKLLSYQHNNAETAS